MSATEIIVGIGCLALGYWLVSVFLPHATKTGTDDPGTRAEDGEQASTRSTGQKHWSDVLGVAPDAGRDTITAAYKRCIAQYHPDKVATMGPEIRDVAQRRSTEINAAYDEAMKQRSL
jgi:DnaJ like chaperone protein